MALCKTVNEYKKSLWDFSDCLLMKKNEQIELLKSFYVMSVKRCINPSISLIKYKISFYV